MICGSNCAGPVKQVAQPAPQETGGASPLVEEFDPRSVREDLILIEPSFPPPSPRTVSPAAESSVRESRPDQSVGWKHVEGGSAVPEGQGAYRVQIVALSSESAARQLAESLGRQLRVEVTVIAQNGLHAVRAGRFTGPEAARVLRTRITEMRSDFADAFVVRDPAPGPGESPTATSSPPGIEPEQDLPVAADAGRVRASGWRVLIFESLDLADAEAYRRKAAERLGRDDVEINFHEPLFKVEIGQFTAGEEAAAQELVALVKRRGFPSALKVRREVTVPKEDQ